MARVYPDDEPAHELWRFLMDRVLDRLASFDPRSRNFPIRAALATRTPRPYTWARGDLLDQGAEGACVGFGVSGELAARPAPVAGIDNAFARGVYYEARRRDEWEGEAYEGTSVLAGMKTAQARHYFDEYRWAFGLDDLVLAIGNAGPVVLGLNWHNDMFDPDENGLLHPSGGIAGGHCVFARGVSIKRKLIRITNSWGVNWGVEGDAFITFDDMRALLADNGEACVPVGRHR